jgi:hypothetical protein
MALSFDKSSFGSRNAINKCFAVISRHGRIVGAPTTTVGAAISLSHERLSNVIIPRTAPRIWREWFAPIMARSHSAWSLVSPIAPVGLGFDGCTISLAIVFGQNNSGFLDELVAEMKHPLAFRGIVIINRDHFFR